VDFGFSNDDGGSDLFVLSYASATFTSYVVSMNLDPFLVHHFDFVIAVILHAVLLFRLEFGSSFQVEFSRSFSTGALTAKKATDVTNWNEVSKRYDAAKKG